MYIQLDNTWSHLLQLQNRERGEEGGRGGALGRRERDLRCHSFTTNGNRKRIQCNQIFHRKYDLLLPLAKQHAFLIRRHIVTERVRKKLSNTLRGVVSKSIRDYFLPICDHCYFVVCNYGQGNPLDYIHPAADSDGSFSSLLTNGLNIWRSINNKKQLTGLSIYCQTTPKGKTWGYILLQIHITGVRLSLVHYVASASRPPTKVSIIQPIPCKFEFLATFMLSSEVFSLFSFSLISM